MTERVQSRPHPTPQSPTSRDFKAGDHGRGQAGGNQDAQLRRSSEVCLGPPLVCKTQQSSLRDLFLSAGGPGRGTPASKHSRGLQREPSVSPFDVVASLVCGSWPIFLFVGN